MSINIGDKPEMNVVNVGDEITTDQLAALQNAQGASATNPCLTRTNTFNTADAAVRITQEGAGDAFVVEDTTNPDSSPFRIDALGNVFLGTSTATQTTSLLVGAAGANFQGTVNFSPTIANRTAIAASSTTSTNHLSTFTQTGTGTIAVFTNTATATSDAVRITNLGTGNSFVVEDSTNPDSTPFVITAAGNVGIGTASAGNALTVSGRASINSSTGGGGDPALAVLNTGTGAVPALNVQVTASTASSSNVALFSNHANATADCVRITNLGTGNSLVVEDSTNPDSTTFVVSNAGDVTLGGSLTLAAGAYAANAALVIDNTNYPHELEFKVGATTYRVPARAI